MGQALSTDKVLANAGQIVNVGKTNAEFSLGNLQLEDLLAKDAGLRSTDAAPEAERRDRSRGTKP